MRSMRGGDVQVCNRSGELHAVRGGDVRTFRRWTTLVRPQRFLPLLTALPPSMKCCVTKLDLSELLGCRGRELLGVSGKYQLAGGQRRGHGLLVQCGVHGIIGRDGVLRVPCGPLQGQRGDRELLGVPGSHGFGARERLAVGLHLQGRVLEVIRGTVRGD